MKNEGFLNIYDDHIDIGFNRYGNAEDGSEDEAVVTMRCNFTEKTNYKNVLFAVLYEVIRMQELGYDVQVFEHRNIEG